MRPRILLSLLLLLTGLAWAQSFPLVDEAPKDPSFLSFRQSLQRTVKNKDWDGLLKVVDPAIVFSYGADEPGKAGFKKFWSKPGQDVWSLLGTILERGGSFSQDHTFVAPYTCSNWPKTKDGQECVAVVGKDIPLYEKADKKSRAFKGVSYCLLQVEPNEKIDRTKWVQVVLPSDYQNALKIKWGFVEAKYVAEPTDYHADFRKRNGQWYLVELNGGC